MSLFPIPKKEIRRSFCIRMNAGIADAVSWIAGTRERSPLVGHCSSEVPGKIKQPAK
jgi:hypothetical protein